MNTSERIGAVVLDALRGLEVDLVDVEVAGGIVRVVVDQEGGIGLDRVAEATRAVSRALDADDPLPGRYTLEVSSPGLERTLRTPDHFARAVGQLVNVKTRPGTAVGRRLRGVLTAADDAGLTLRLEGDAARPNGVVTIRFDDVERARTVFEWGPAPKPGRGSKPGKAAKGSLRSDGAKAAKGPKAARRPAADDASSQDPAGVAGERSRRDPAGEAGGSGPSNRGDHPPSGAASRRSGTVNGDGHEQA
ncbi:MAG: ribosome maturation factor RimP [Acidimicrobiia bacterium]|nr:ribosome maturation factor RimP [Acidimicrobiia bacterium]